MKKGSKILMSALLSLSVLSGCGSQNKETKKTTITFWHAMSGEQEKTLKDLTAKFEKANPNIKVELSNQGQYKDLQSKLTTAQASPKTLPNITQAYGDWLEEPIKNGKVVNLKGKIDTSDYVENFVKPLKIDNGLYGVPFSKSTEVLVYNKDVVDKLGLKIPTTYDEYYQFCKTIHEKTGMNGGGFDNLSNFYQTYLYNKGELLSEKTDVQGKISQEACEYLQKGMKDESFRQAGSDLYLNGPFASKQVASYVGTNGGLSFVKKGVGDKFKWDVALAPSGKTMQQGTDLFVFDKQDDQANEACVKYLQFLTNEESQVTWGVKTGYIPMNKKALQNKEYANSDHAKLLAKAAHNTFTTPFGVKRNKLYLDARITMEEVANGKSIDKALQEYQKRRNQIYKK